MPNTPRHTLDGSINGGIQTAEATYYECNKKGQDKEEGKDNLNAMRFG
jgi:hypothetical protein